METFKKVSIMTAEYFSGHFSTARTRHDDWFDPILGADTRLFVDPFLVFHDKSKEWAGSHDELIAYFNIVFHMIASTLGKPASLERQKAMNLLRFPEPEAFCLGYVGTGTKGAGSGSGYAQSFSIAMELAIARGIKDLTHSEELGVLNEGIGPDRISDLTCNVLIERFIGYTERVVKRHKVPTKAHKIERGEFDVTGLRWKSVTRTLPTNPTRAAR